MEDDAEHYGPLMQGLTEHQRAFVIQLLTNPHKPATEWARAAGFTDGTGIKVRAHHLRHNPKILAAAREEAGRHLNREGVAMAVAVLVHELSSPDAKTRLAAANSILDRGGVTAKTEHTVRVEHNVEQMEAIAQRLAVELGIEPMKLIGGNTVDLRKPQHGETLDAESQSRGTTRVPSGVCAEVEGHPPSNAGSEGEGYRPLDCGGLQEPGQARAAAVRDVQQPEGGDAPRRLQQAPRGPLAVPPVPSPAASAADAPEPSEGAKERVRQQMDIDSDVAF